MRRLLPWMSRVSLGHRIRRHRGVGCPLLGIVVSVEMLLLLLVLSFLMEASDFKCIGGVCPVHVVERGRVEEERDVFT